MSHFRVTDFKRFSSYEIYVFMLRILIEKKKSSKKKSAKMVEKRERSKSKRIDQFNQNVARIGQTTSAASNDLNDSDEIITAPRSINNRRLLMDSYVEPDGRRDDDIVVLDDEKPEKTSRLSARISRLSPIDDQDECEIILEKGGSKKPTVCVDLEDEDDDEFNKWLVNETFQEPEKSAQFKTVRF